MIERTVTRWHLVSDNVLFKIGEVAQRLNYYLQEYANLEMQIEEEIKYMEIDDGEEIDTVKTFCAIPCPQRNSVICTR